MTIEDEVFVGPNVVFTNDLVPRVAFKKPPEQFLPTLRPARRHDRRQRDHRLRRDDRRAARSSAPGRSSIRDVPPHALVVGNPARRVGWVCACSEKLSAALACACGRRYQLVDATGGLVPA